MWKPRVYQGFLKEKTEYDSVSKVLECLEDISAQVLVLDHGSKLR